MAFLALLIVVGGPVLIGIVLATAIGGVTSVIIAAITWLAIGGIVAMVLAWGYRFWRPVNALIATAGRLADGDYTARVGHDTAMMRPVAASFNRMAERLERAETERRQLMADVSHELRTPLTLIRGELEAMADGVHELDLARVGQLLGDVAVMERLLDDLQTLSSAEAGELKVHRETVALGSLVTAVVDRFAPDARTGGITLTAEVAPDRNGWEAEVDPVRVQEIVANLVRNAIRATPPDGTVTVRLGPGPTTEPAPPPAVIEVADTGRGIPADEVDQVFDRFHSGPESDGTGLGLTISRNLARAHGGDITIVSTVDRGTTATVTLPRSPD